MALIQHKGAIKGLSTAPVHDLRQAWTQGLRGQSTAASIANQTLPPQLAVQSSLTGMLMCICLLWGPSAASTC